MSYPFCLLFPGGMGGSGGVTSKLSLLADSPGAGSWVGAGPFFFLPPCFFIFCRMTSQQIYI